MSCVHQNVADNREYKRPTGQMSLAGRKDLQHYYICLQGVARAAISEKTGNR